MEQGKDKEWGGREGGGFIAVGVRGWGCTDPIAWNQPSKVDINGYHDRPEPAALWAFSSRAVTSSLTLRRP